MLLACTLGVMEADCLILVPQRAMSVCQIEHTETYEAGIPKVGMMSFSPQSYAPYSDRRNSERAVLLNLERCAYVFLSMHVFENHFL
jgi:hypothetical protein